MSGLKLSLTYTWAALLIATLLTGCATGAKRVDCTGRLEPINAPPPTQKERKPARAAPAPANTGSSR